MWFYSVPNSSNPSTLLAIKTVSLAQKILLISLSCFACCSLEIQQERGEYADLSYSFFDINEIWLHFSNSKLSPIKVGEEFWSLFHLEQYLLAPLSFFHFSNTIKSFTAQLKYAYTISLRLYIGQWEHELVITLRESLNHFLNRPVCLRCTPSISCSYTLIYLIIYLIF